MNDDLPQHLKDLIRGIEDDERRWRRDEWRLIGQFVGVVIVLNLMPLLAVLVFGL